jgi:hypothetical protein
MQKIMKKWYKAHVFNYTILNGLHTINVPSPPLSETLDQQNSSTWTLFSLLLFQDNMLCSLQEYGIEFS